MTARQRIHGILGTKSVELPFETKEEQQQADKMNRELGGLGRVFRSATDWSMTPYDRLRANMNAQQIQQARARRRDDDALTLQSGDLMRIFSTVTDGDVHWQGTVKFDRRKYHHGLQRGMDGAEWGAMFGDAMPARLVQDGREMFGALEPFCETGTEGIVWSVMEYGRNGYDALHCLRDGDELTVYSAVRDGSVEWSGALDFGPRKIEKVDWTEILRKSRHMETKKWLDLSWQRRPVLLMPNPAP
jgi:hypothetical protein